MESNVVQPVEYIVDCTCSSGALELINNTLARIDYNISSIRVLLICFLIWFVICALYKFLNMFF